MTSTEDRQLKLRTGWRLEGGPACPSVAQFDHVLEQRHLSNFKVDTRMPDPLDFGRRVTPAIQSVMARTKGQLCYGELKQSWLIVEPRTYTRTLDP